MDARAPAGGSEPFTTGLAGAKGWAIRAGAKAVMARVTDLVESSHAFACAVLVLLSLAWFLPGFVSLQPMDRDEPRYAQATKQMLETGDYVDIRFQDEARHKKPIGIYWLQAASVKAADALGLPAARTTIAAYRVPSLIGAIATVLLTYWAALAFTSRRGAFMAAALMGASVILLVEARLAKTDAALTACCVAAMGGLARAYLFRDDPMLPYRTTVFVWLAVAAGVLIKGPLLPIFVGLAAVTLAIRERSGRWLMRLRPKLGLLMVVALVAPWFVAISIKSGGAFYSASIGHDLAGKVGTAQTYHWAPPGFYLLSFFATFWPGAVLAAIAVPFAWINRRDDRVAFALAWIVPCWVLLEAVPTKLPHYVMPLYPAVAIVTVLAIAKGFVGPGRPGAKLAALLIPAIPVGLTVGLAVAGAMLDRAIPFAALPILAGASLVAAGAYVMFRRGQIWGGAAAGILASAVLALGVFGVGQTLLRSLKLSPRMAEVAKNVPCNDPAVASLGYREPSLIFLVGTDLELLESGREAAEFLRGGGCRVAFVERRFDDAFRKEAERQSIRPALSTRLSGFNINNGRHLEIGAYYVTP